MTSFCVFLILVLIKTTSTLHLNHSLLGNQSKYQPRIINGLDVDSGKWPFMVSIMFNGGDDKGLQPFCGGSILNDDTILTAAHCLLAQADLIKPDVTMIYIGHVDITKVDSSSLYQAKTFISNPDFSLEDLKKGYDVAVIKLSKPIDLTQDPSIGQVCMPNPGEEAVVDKCVVMGWGTTADGQKGGSTSLKEVTVPIVASSECVTRKGKFNVDTIICAGYAEGGKDSCQGDSGGPLMCPMASNPAQWLQFGIVSFGEGCAKTFGYYTNVSALVDWITEKAEQ